jgi:hypothetical protein
MKFSATSIAILAFVGSGGDSSWSFHRSKSLGGGVSTFASATSDQKLTKKSAFEALMPEDPFGLNSIEKGADGKQGVSEAAGGGEGLAEHEVSSDR